MNKPDVSLRDWLAIQIFVAGIDSLQRAASFNHAVISLASAAYAAADAMMAARGSDKA